MLLASPGKPSRWKTVVAEIEALEDLRGLPPLDSAPAEYDAEWIDERIRRLEASLPTTNGSASPP